MGTSASTSFSFDSQQPQDWSPYQEEPINNFLPSCPHGSYLVQKPGEGYVCLFEDYPPLIQEEPQTSSSQGLLQPFEVFFPKRNRYVFNERGNLLF